MASLNDIRAGLKARLATIPGARTYAVEPASPQPPALWIYGPLPGSQYDQDFSGGVRYYFAIYAATTPADTARSQTSVDTYLDSTGSNSIRAAIRGDETLGGVADYARVIGVEEAPHLGDIAGSQLMIASVRCEVRAV